MIHKNKGRSFNLIHIIHFYFLIIFSILNFISHEAQSTNKESYILVRENFSNETDIDFKGLYRHIHYTFKNESYLIEALYPLLPQKIRQAQQKFEHLEFLGDAVLGLITRERILSLFPNESRGVHNKLYEALICNKTLAEAYTRNLNIERYIPYPEKEKCKYCNLVEALIGAIFRDDQSNSLVQARKFVMFILNDHMLIEKCQDIRAADEQKKLQNNGLPTPLIAQSPGVLPTLQATFKRLSETQDLATLNPKSLLGMILSSTLQDQPEYVFSLGKNPQNVPGYIAKVVGSQIGHTISGFGFTKKEAEEEAARNAVNFLAQKDFIPYKKSVVQNQTYIQLINEYCQVQNLRLLSDRYMIANPTFAYCVKVDDEIIAEGEGNTKSLAAENAAQNAYQYLIINKKIDCETLNPSKGYRSILKEWKDHKKISGYQLIEKEVMASPQFQHQVKVGEDILVIKTGNSIENAHENAFQAVFEQLLEKQEKASKGLLRVVKKSLVIDSEPLKQEAKEKGQDLPPLSQIIVKDLAPLHNELEKAETNQVSSSPSLNSDMPKKAKVKKNKKQNNKPIYIKKASNKDA